MYLDGVDEKRWADLLPYARTLSTSFRPSDSQLDRDHCDNPPMITSLVGSGLSGFAMIKPAPADTKPTVSEAAPIHRRTKSRLGFCGSRPVTERKNPAGIKIAVYSTPSLSCFASAGTPSVLVKIVISDPRSRARRRGRARPKESFLQVVRRRSPGMNMEAGRCAVGDADKEYGASGDHVAGGENHVSSPSSGWFVG